MEKAKFLITKSKKGKIVVTLILKNNKPFPFPNFKIDNIESLNGKEVDVERDKNGQVVRIVMDGKEIFSKTISTKTVAGANVPTTQLLKMTHTSNTVTAPYNFVPLNEKEKVVPAECNPCKDFYFDKYHEGRFTGYINLTIKTETPLYIRDTLTKEEIDDKDRIEKDTNNKQKYINPDFFSPAGNPRIPGSSLRGMIRTMVEILSYSRMQFIDHTRKYHFRSFADKSLDLRKYYRNRMMAGNDTTGYHQQVKAGYLTNDGITYKIKPAKEVTPKSDLQYARVENTLASNANVLGKLFTYRKVKFTCNSPNIDNNHKKPLYHAKVTGISKEDENTLSNPQIGYLIQSGNMPNKHMHWVIAEVDGNAAELEFMEGAIENYRNDTNRNVGEGSELLKQCKRGSDVPCFYIEENNKVISFGHTGLFRLAYKKSVGEFLPSAHRNFNGPDIAEAIFGNEETFASRVFFEDAFLDDNQQNDFQESVPKILSTPKPTTFQHYLEQYQPITFQKQPEEGYLGLQNYNDDTLLRGNKLYWHKLGDQYEEEKLTFWQNDFNSILRDNNLNRDLFNDHVEQKSNKITVSLATLPPNLKGAIVKAVGKYETQHTRIKPINKDKTFTGRIRFENLSKVELGALLSSLDLPPDCCHKLGMGKPLGLGSVKITPMLYLSNRKERYESLVAEWDEVPESAKDGEKIKDFKDAFEEYVLSKLGENGKKYWELDRVKELERMLKFGVGKQPDDKKTQYMTIQPNQFKDRKVLPKPTEV